jgi:chromosome segregation ATPase
MLTPLAAAQSASDQSELCELRSDLKTLRGQLEEAREKLAAETAARLVAEADSARLRSSLQETRSALDTAAEELKVKTAALAVSENRVDSARETTAELRHSQAMWSSLFMAGMTGFDTTKFQQLMSTTTSAAGKQSEQPGGPSGGKQPEQPA